MIAVVAMQLALPWAAADLGFSLDGVPGLRSIFLTGSLRTQPGDPVFHPAVHRGHHHGMDGTLLVLVALILSRLVGAVRGRVLRGVFGAYLAPDVPTPKVSEPCGLILLGAACLWLLLVLPGLRRGRQDGRSSTATP